MTEGEQIAQNLGYASRNIQQWLGQQRQTAKPSADALSGAWGVELVARTFATASQESRDILQGVLDLLDEEDFPIMPLLRLTTHLDKIWPSDPNFAANVYAAVYGYDERSRDQMQFGSPILPLTISRRDEYHSCRHQLQQHLPKFLRAEPMLACRTMIGALNGLILQEHVEPYLRPGATLTDLDQSFDFRGRRAAYTSDGSFIWDETQFPEDIKEVVDELCKFILELATEARLMELDAVLDAWGETAQVAFFWRRLLGCAAQNANVFAPRLFELCLARPVQAGNDTVRELGTFISAAAPYFDATQFRALETSILMLADGDVAEISQDQRERRRDRFLSCLPLGRLQTSEAREICQRLTNEGRDPTNAPLITFSHEETQYDLAMMLEEAGVDLARSQNDQLRQWLDELSAFSTHWQNKRPPEADLGAILPTARMALQALSNLPNEEQLAWRIGKTTVATCAAAMSRGIGSADSEAFAFCQPFLLDCAVASALPQGTIIDQTVTVHAWSPSPQTEAAEGLPWLIRLRPNREMLDAITALATASVPAVRYEVVSELFRLSDVLPEEFWALCDQIARDERNPSVQSALCNSVAQVLSRDERRATKVLTEMALHARLDNDGAHLGENLTALAVWWKLERDNSWASSFLSDLLREPIHYAVPIKQAVHQALNFARPRTLSSANATARLKAERSLAWLSEAMGAAIGGLRELRVLPKEDWMEGKLETARNVYGVIDHILLRLYTGAEIHGKFQEQGAAPLTDGERRRYYESIKPLLQQALVSLEDTEHGLIFASTAHHLMELLAGVVSYDPVGVLRMAYRIALAAERTGYTMDGMAVREVVNLVETVLANHATVVREGEPLQDLLGLLACFAKTGWPDALRLVWRLDELFK